VRRGGAIAKVEGDRWLVSLLGVGDDLAPTEDAGFLEFADSLNNPHLAECISLGIPLTPIHRYASVGNHWRQYHRARSWPDRLIAVGDSVCTFNPLYGQGLTVAALEALQLRGALHRHVASGSLDGLAARFQRSIARTVRVPWLLGSSVDLGWQPDQSSKGDRLVGWYMAHLLGAIPDSPGLYRRFARAQHMIGSPVSLAHPWVVGKVVAHAYRRSPVRNTPENRIRVAPLSSDAPRDDVGGGLRHAR
jgi:hypothetical protein